MGIWHQCEELKNKLGLIRKYVWGGTWMILKDEKTTIWNIKFCPYCGIKLEDLK